ncbi:unnamed protein product [Moneuplotes crassus]|uniref:Uncharacterized protein n=1 Tax=Euplotes crassus TaxID=5936 RepID=A0AAD1XJY4_EUPCR|nr:unnamed protein product [Moneuplotes crassus]
MKQQSAEDMTKRYFDLKKTFGDIHQRVVHPDIGGEVAEEDTKEDLLEEFTDYLSILPKELHSKPEERKGEFSDTFAPYIGIVPLISVKKPKEKIVQKDIYAQYRKNYLADLTKLIECYFPPLKVMFLDPLQVTKYETSNYKKVDPEFSTIINMENSKEYKIMKILGRMNVFHMAKAIRPLFSQKFCTIIALTIEPIYDQKPKEGSFILGRACGRVCIATMDNTTRAESFQTIVHEAMHTFGLGHCEKWNCIMNWLSLDQHRCFLCLPDLIKMQHLFGFDIKERYLKLAKLYKRTLGWQDDYDWVKQAIDKINEKED